ncbi:MAG: ABC transporter ATP-binding protein [Planctomycetota bacterium]|jgi:osmoprotectant transport system ATP-binding protein
MISLRGVGKSYDDGATWAVRDLDLDVQPGERMVLLGESGCGKTTTLRMINRLIEASTGAIHVDGRDVRATDPVALRRGIGYVLQGVGLFPHMTVAENVGVVPSLLGWSPDDIAPRTDELLDLVGLPPAEFGPRRPEQLSGGQRQRVGVARALAGRPAVMLMDEPFGALDPLTRDALQEEFAQLQRALELTVLMVSHDMTEALLLADRIAVLHEGRIVGLGTPADLLADPPHEQVRKLLEMPRRHAERLASMAHARTRGDAPGTEGA